ncbi:hypothetical protein [Facilibium subflavum]|uniref:hypothetical protein n=1 Tax=Facilibium subflavum TaxID=2219058 RepID=UPI000E65D241|nr:hypothetical protein [Facilibium subflavum]
MGIKKYLYILTSIIALDVGYANATTSHDFIQIKLGDGVDSLNYTARKMLSASGDVSSNYVDQNNSGISTYADGTSYYFLYYYTDWVTSAVIASDYQSRYMGQSAWVWDYANLGWPDTLAYEITGDFTINGKREAEPHFIGTTFADGYKDGGFHGWMATDSADTEVLDSKGMDYDYFTSANWLPIFTDDGDQYCLYENTALSYEVTVQRCGDSNWIYLIPKDNVQSLSFTLDGLSVADNSAYYSKLTKNEYSSKLSLLMNAERHDSGAIANDFFTKIGTSSPYTFSDSTGTPDKLSFYAYGRLSINGSEVDTPIYFGVSSEHGYNLYIDGPGATHGNNVLTIHTKSGATYCLTPDENGNHDTFYIGSCDNDQGGDSGTSSHDNYVRLYPGSGVSSLSFNFKGFDVSSGQPYQTNLSENQYKDGFLEMNFQAGRHKTGAVADSYRSYVGDHSSYARNTSDDYPGELNFYFYGALKINGSPVINDVYLGQGSNNSGNNWWFGSADAWQDGSTYFMWVKTVDGRKYCISNGDENDYTFMVSDRCPKNDTTPHMNEFDFVLGEGVYSLSFEMENGDDMVTSGQPHGDQLSQNKLIAPDSGDSCDDDNYQIKLVFNSGRSKSSDVKNSFNSLTNFYIDNMGRNYDAIESLNFYYYGYLTINGAKTTSPVYIAQGHTTGISSTVWFIGSADSGNLDSYYTIALYTQDHKCYSLHANSDDSQDLKPKVKIQGCYV